MDANADPNSPREQADPALLADASALAPPRVNVTPDQSYDLNHRAWQGVPTIACPGGDRLVASWYTGGPGEGPHNHVVLAVSEDAGHTWHDPLLVIDPPGAVRAFDPILWVDPSGRLWLFWSQGLKLHDGRYGVWAVQLDLPAPGDRQTRIRSTTPRRLCDGILANKPTVLRDGRWLLPAAVWDRPPRHPAFDALRFSNVFVSDDAGETWALLGQPDVPARDADEHMVVEHANGDLRVFVRTKQGIGQAVSHDGGQCWTALKPALREHPSTRTFHRRLASGRWLRIYHAHATQRSHLAAALSDDEGQTWSKPLLLDERVSVSYPDADEDEAGRIWLIYDWDRLNAGELLLQCFTEQDVLAGRSPERVVISQLMK